MTLKEGSVLAQYASFSDQSRGRLYPENPSRSRTEYQRDRDRIIHSSAFRRLEYKTQVFVNHEGDLFRTRLTHTLEVAQLSRNAADRLMLNPDLSESIALAHDLGHTPFGHAGQTALDECMKPYGGFEHNLQSLRIIDKLEEQYPEYDGLNLTWETREGVLKHCEQSKAHELGDLGERFFNGTQPSLEAQLVNIADAIAYSTHDIDDGLRVGYIDREMLAANVPIYEHYWKEVRHDYPNISRRRQEKEVVRRLIGFLMDDLICTSMANIEAAAPKSVADVRALKEPLVRFSEGGYEQLRTLKKYLFDNLYRHYKVIRVVNKSARMIKELFNEYEVHPELLPPHYAERLKGESVQRIAADYISGMTDRYAVLEYKRVLDPTSEL